MNAVSAVNTAAARQQLEEIEAELGRSIAVLDRAHPQQDTAADYPPDPADAGTNQAEMERADAVIAVARQQLARVRSALQRIDQGTYGICVDCGADVPAGRLAAKPEAARCVSCQAASDRRDR